VQILIVLRIVVGRSDKGLTEQSQAILATFASETGCEAGVSWRGMISSNLTPKKEDCGHS
jgi:hypothetical protein